MTAAMNRAHRRRLGGRGSAPDMANVYTAAEKLIVANIGAGDMDAAATRTTPVLEAVLASTLCTGEELGLLVRHLAWRTAALARRLEVESEAFSVDEFKAELADLAAGRQRVASGLEPDGGQR